MKQKSIFKKQFGPFKYCHLGEITTFEAFGYVVFRKFGSRWTIKPHKTIKLTDI